MDSAWTIKRESSERRWHETPAWPADATDELPPAAAGLAMLPALMAGLDTLAQGVALVAADSRLAYANASAHTCLARAGWTQDDDGVLRAGSGREHAQWLEALHRVCHAERRLLFELRTPKASSFAALVPVSAGDRRWVFVTFGREELCGVLELQMFASRHGLTHAEGQVLRKLSVGMKPAEIAQAHGVCLSTVMTQVASVRAKTVAPSVRQLLSTLSRLPPLRLALVSAGTETA